MTNKKMKQTQVKEKLFRNNALHTFDKAWAQVEATGKFAVEANGGWVIGTISL